MSKYSAACADDDLADDVLAETLRVLALVRDDCEVEVEHITEPTVAALARLRGQGRITVVFGSFLSDDCYVTAAIVRRTPAEARKDWRGC